MLVGLCTAGERFTKVFFLGGRCPHLLLLVLVLVVVVGVVGRVVGGLVPAVTPRTRPRP